VVWELYWPVSVRLPATAPKCVTSLQCYPKKCFIGTCLLNSGIQFCWLFYLTHLFTCVFNSATELKVMRTPKMCPTPLKSLFYHVPSVYSSFCNGSWIISTWFVECSLRWITMMIKPTSAFKYILNWLHSQHKPHTCFGHLLWLSSERYITKDVLPRISKLVYKYK
jgi:hypothetical protein